MKYEKTQKGNPHKLTVKEHTFPARSISRFTKDNGKVSVSLISKDKVLERKPCDQLFCAKRAWDQNVESEFMKSIEYKYQSLDFDIILRNKEKIKE